MSHSHSIELEVFSTDCFFFLGGGGEVKREIRDIRRRKRKTGTLKS